MFIKNHQEKKKHHFSTIHLFVEKTNFHNVSFTLFSHFFSQPPKKSPSPPPTFLCVFFRGKGRHLPCNPTNGGCNQPVNGHGHEELAGLICVAMERRPWLRPAVPLTRWQSPRGFSLVEGVGFDGGRVLVALRIRQGLVRFIRVTMGFMKESRNITGVV